MQYFIGIVPPKNIRDTIRGFQKQFFARGVTQLHITLKSPGGLSENTLWLDPASVYLKTQHPFAVSFGGVSQFGGSVVFLEAHCIQLHEIHSGLIEIINPSESIANAYFENKPYTPHLTLGKSMWGLSNTKISTMKECAERELLPLPSFTAEFARIYVNKTPHDSYQTLKDIYFAGR